MDFKKYLFVLLAFLVIVSTISVASAGLFDFLGGGDLTLNGDLEEKTLKYSFENLDDSTFLDGTGFWSEGDMTYSGKLVIDLKDASDDDLNKLEESLKSDNITMNINTSLNSSYLFYDLSDVLEFDKNDVKYSLDGNKLNVEFDCIKPTRFNIEKEFSDKFKVNEGNITIPDKGVTVTF
jgi:hypothetical protein